MLICRNRLHHWPSEQTIPFVNRQKICSLKFISHLTGKPNQNSFTPNNASTPSAFLLWSKLVLNSSKRKPTSFELTLKIYPAYLLWLFVLGVNKSTPHCLTYLFWNWSNPNNFFYILFIHGNFPLKSRDS